MKSWGRADTQRAFDLIESAKFSRNGDRFTFSFGEQQAMQRPRQDLTTNQILALGGVALVLALIVLR